MLISGFIKNSLIDYPGKIASVIFTQGCNMRCKFCHNHELISINGSYSNYSEDEILYYLKKASGFIDALVITGGEPTLQSDLEDFIRSVKQLGILVKLDTNGTYPKLLKKLIDEKLIDYVAMDIKHILDLSSYRELVGNQFSEHQLKNVKESIALLKEANVEVEFRTTLIQGSQSADDVRKICEQLQCSNLYSLQKFNPLRVFDPSFAKRSTFSDEEMLSLMESNKDIIPNIRVVNAD
ncbi:anaerobic ribonucleoside-triphosphate reductase activating protein [Marinifilum fragile]|uniref:anaerobic ribonucleoside-triphosphate reductase activating protein n=1 Tax=Marinifilum fragile TaxID=570161 RepID=UPI002AA5EDDC|nr:anaerobic ribonucleoside-triphosphate reductase activating protein [Marinifilum fragile]